MNPTAQILLYTVRIKKNAKYPLKLRIVYRRVHRDFYLGMDLTELEFKNASLQKPAKHYRQIAVKITDYKDKANKVIGQLAHFTFSSFEAKFFGDQKNSSDIFPFFDEYIKKVKDDERIKTASSYQTAMNAFKRFHGDKMLNFYDITTEFLNRFQKWMITNGNGSTSVGIYTRSLRAVFNYCISLGIIKRDENYPFGRNKFIIPAGRNIKKALTLAEIKKIYDYRPNPGTFEDRSKDFWMFSYLCNGMNFKDIAVLKQKNIQGEMLRFVREKTKKTSQGNQVTISCFLTPEALHIIDKWSNKTKDPDEYIFSIISRSDTLEKKGARIDQFIQTTNKNMKRICILLKLEKVVTTYWARHSMASILKRSGTSIAEISEALGHANSSVTQKYLDSFEDDTKRELAITLSKFH